MTCTYRFAVSASWLCPSTCCTTRRSAPSANSQPAAVWRRWWNGRRASPARASSAW